MKRQNCLFLFFLTVLFVLFYKGCVSFIRIFGNQQLSEIEIKDVADAHAKYGNDENAESKGVKAHFRMDESGILNLESVRWLIFLPLPPM